MLHIKKEDSFFYNTRFITHLCTSVPVPVASQSVPDAWKSLFIKVGKDEGMSRSHEVSKFRIYTSHCHGQDVSLIRVCTKHIRTCRGNGYLD